MGRREARPDYAGDQEFACCRERPQTQKPLPMADMMGMQRAAWACKDEKPDRLTPRRVR